MRVVAPGISVGNALEARDIRAVLSAEFRAIVDLAIEEPPIAPTRDLIYCRIPLNDGGGNSDAQIRMAVDTVSGLRRAKIAALVACSGGMSRSPSIVAASISRDQAIPFDQALLSVCGDGPRDVSPALLADIIRVLDMDA